MTDIPPPAPTTAPAGWYDAGDGSGRQRWFDGAAWTDQFHQPAGSPPPPGSPRPAGKSALPIVAISLAGFALILSFAAAGVAWLPAIAAIVVAIVALIRKAEPRILSTIAVIVGPIAWIIAIVVAFAGFSAGFRDATDSSQLGGGGPVGEQEVAEPEAPGDDGSSLDAPLPAGSVVRVDSFAGLFDVSFGTVNWDATTLITNENMFNSEPDEGMKYIMVPVTMTNVDDEEWNASGTFFWGDIKLVSDGQGFSEGALVVAPGDLSDQAELYPGGTATGNVVFLVPDDVVDGTWDADGTFVAAK